MCSASAGGREAGAAGVIRIGLMPDPLFELVDAGLESGNLVLQLLEAALQNLSPANVVGQQTLDPPKSLNDGIVLLLQPVEPSVDFVEMTEDLPEPLVDSVESLVDRVKAPVDGEEPLINDGELAPEKLDEALIITRSHGRPLPLPDPRPPVKRLHSDTSKHGLV